MADSSKIVVVALLLLGGASCAHPNRISRGELRRLTKAHDPFVLVFGSVSTTPGTLAHPVIKFVHQKDRKAPEYLLWSLKVTSGDRFYAVLRRPPELPFLDEFDTEVGSDESGFDRVLFVRLHQGDAPLAMYIGAMEISPAQNRTAQSQKVAVSIHDDFENAARELKRLYPAFQGTVTKAAVMRNLAPLPAPPERAH